MEQKEVGKGRKQKFPASKMAVPPKSTADPPARNRLFHSVTLENLWNNILLIILQAVLGDNFPTHRFQITIIVNMVWWPEHLFALVKMLGMEPPKSLPNKQTCSGHLGLVNFAL